MAEATFVGRGESPPASLFTPPAVSRHCQSLARSGQKALSGVGTAMLWKAQPPESSCPADGANVLREAVLLREFGRDDIGDQSRPVSSRFLFVGTKAAGAHWPSFGAALR